MTAPTDLSASITKWFDNACHERASSQGHFLDLRRRAGRGLKPIATAVAGRMRR